MANPDLPGPTTTCGSAKLVNFSRPNADFTGPFDLLAYVLEKNDPAATRACYYEWTEVVTTLRIAATDRTNVTWVARCCLASLTIRGEPGLQRDGTTR